MKRRFKLLLIGMAALAAILTGCSGGRQTISGGDAGGNHQVSEGLDTNLGGALVLAIWDNNLMAYIDESDMVGRFRERYPNATIEVEKIKDDSEYWNAMKMRSSANQLPDVMLNKPFSLSRFSDYLLDLSNLEAVANNELAAGYALDGKILGVPMTATYEYVYYWKDMFAEAGVKVPTTWSQLQEAALKLQEHFGRDNGDFMAIALGAKDEWPSYPYMEFMPVLEGGNGQNWNDMARQDYPFAVGTDTYKAYRKSYELFTSGVFGRDPLGLGNDQVTALFAQKEAAILALGNWGLQNILNGTDDVSELGTFYLPVRDSENDSFRVIVQGDSFMGVTTHSKNPELAKAFVEWFYSEAWYPGFIEYVTSSSAMVNFPKEKPPVLAEADSHLAEMELVMYDGGGDDFQSIQNETAFDYKKLGAEMFMENFDFDARMAELNEKWLAARIKLGIK